MVSNEKPRFIEMNRLESFSDGVFAIAITLLGLELKVPDVGEDGAALWASLLQLWPSYLALVVSFGTVFIMWMNHHAIFKYVRGADAAFSIANGFLLLLVTVVPFSTALVARYLNKPGANAACAAYAGLFVLINIAYNSLWRMASHRRRLLKHEVEDSSARSISMKLGIGFPGYIVATLVAFYSPLFSLLTCCILWVLWGRMAVEHFVPKHYKGRVT